MFCQNCGAKNEAGARVCAKCGVEMVDNQPGKNPNVSTTAQLAEDAKKVSKKIKKVPKIVKIMAGAVVALLILAFAVVQLGASAAKPQKIAMKYFEAWASADWDKVYGYLALEESEFINKENFRKFMENAEVPNVINSEITDDIRGTAKNSKEDKDLVKSFVVNYTSQGESSQKNMSINLVKNSGKKWFFFDDWSVSSENLVALNLTLSVLKGSTVSLNDIPLSSPSLDGESHEKYVLHGLFVGTYTAVVKNDMLEDITQEIQVQAGGRENYMKVAGGEVKRAVYDDLAVKSKDYLNKIMVAAAAGKAFGEIGIDVTATKASQSYYTTDYAKQIQESYNGVLNKWKPQNASNTSQYKNFKLKAFEEQNVSSNSGAMTCQLSFNITYDYAMKYAETETPYSDQQKQITFTFVYENEKWVLQAIQGVNYL